MKQKQSNEQKINETTKCWFHSGIRIQIQIQIDEVFKTISLAIRSSDLIWFGYSNLILIRNQSATKHFHKMGNFPETMKLKFNKISDADSHSHQQYLFFGFDKSHIISARIKFWTLSKSRRKLMEWLSQTIELTTRC